MSSLYIQTDEEVGHTSTTSTYINVPKGQIAMEKEMYHALRDNLYKNGDTSYSVERQNGNEPLTLQAFHYPSSNSDFNFFSARKSRYDYIEEDGNEALLYRYDRMGSITRILTVICCAVAIIHNIYTFL